MSSTEMKSYLSLIPISAKVRRRQNRMTILCIVLAVFLVTAVFSMADMAIRMETSNQLNKNGNWHIMVKDISPETAAELAAQEDVAAFSAYSDINASLTENYFAGDKRAALVGADDAILQIFPGMQCSTAPADGEVLVTANIRDWLDVTVGTAIPLTLPDGQTISLTVAGFNEDTSDTNQYDAVVLVMNRSTFSQIAAQVEESFETQYFIQFKPRTNLRQSIVNIENKYGISEEKISENTYLMALNASSNNDYIVGLYAVAAVLAGMVVLAGIFMITGSINSNVAQRTSYYGMLRCLGAGKNQVRMLVRLEALFWCKTAVPAGCVLGIVSTWGLCSFLRGFIGEEFSSLPVLGISPVGIICGSALGLITVWFAASSPARRAAKASPITAATGNAVENAADSPCHARLFGSRAELSLGVSHATSSKKNLLLMTGSFALSILLFLSFSVLLRWVGFALNPVQSIQTQLEEALTLHQRLSRRGRAEAVKDAIAAVGLDLPVLSRYPGELSGGMGQRVMIALALLNNPKVLIADEPTSALDARLRNQILELLVEQCAQRQMAMLLISHDLPLVAAHCDRVLVMYQGRQVDEMPARALPSATHPYTRTLWTCRPNAHTYGQMLPTLDRTQDFTETAHGDR